MEMAVNNIAFLAGGGEMGELTREKNWDKTSLGRPETWPQSLRTTLSIILNSKFPMFLFWGKELLCFYNDAYRPSLGKEGKHPSILGMKGEQAWTEIWQIIKPLIDQVLAGGEATWSEDQLIPIYRNGKLEDVYWTFSYSPVNDESGDPAGIFVTCTETTEKILTYKKIEEAKRELEFAIEATELGTWDYNPVTNKFTSNERLKNWFGLPDMEHTGLDLAISAVHETDRQRLTDAIQAAMDFSSGGHFDIDYTIVHPVSKTETIVHAKGRAWFNDEKVAYRFNGTLEDVTLKALAERNIKESESRYRELSLSLEHKVRKRTEELGLKNIDLEKMNKELQSFAYISSHDLQEPLRKIQTFATLLLAKETKNLSENGKDIFKRMQNAASRMQSLINDLLSYSRTNTTDRVFEITDLNNILDEIKTDLKEEIKQKNATIEAEGLHELSIIPFQFRQLLYNLISNSLKFSTPARAPRIKITSTFVSGAELKNGRLSEETEYCHLHISDNGIGFEPHFSEKIFELFQRLHGKGEYGGTGIGLAIVKKIVENHHGTITATGELNVGAQFDIYLPVSR